MRDAFTEALDVDYENVFLQGGRVLDTLPSSGETEVALEALMAAAEYVTSRVGVLRQDLTGRIYHSALGKTVAKNFATYYTRIPAAELLAWLSIEGWDSKIADFACGSGTLLTSAYHRKLGLALPRFQEAGLSSVDEIHRRFIEDDIWGFDAMPFAAHLTAVNLALQHPRVAFKKSRVYYLPVTSGSHAAKRLGSLDLLSSTSVAIQARIEGQPSGPRRQSVDLSMRHAQLTLERECFDNVIMNPPFTSGDRACQILHTPSANKAVQATGLVDIKVHMTGLAAPFVLLAHLYLRPGGRVALVLPTAVTSRETWKPIRELLANNYHLEHLIISWAERTPAFSEDVDLRELLLVARKLRPGEKPGHTVVTHLDEDITFMQARELAEVIRKVDPRRASIRTEESQAVLSGRRILGESKTLAPGMLRDCVDNWYQFLAFRNPELVKTVLALQGYLRDPGYSIPPELASHLLPLRTIANVNWYLKYTSSAGYVRVRQHPGRAGVPYLASSNYAKVTFSPSDYKEWIVHDPTLTRKKTLEIQPAHLHLPRKTNLYSTTRVTGVYSEEPVIGSMWHPVLPTVRRTSDGKDLSQEEACKLIALWANSTFGQLLLVATRQETEGAYGEWKTTQIEGTYTLNPGALRRDQVDTLLEEWQTLEKGTYATVRLQLEEILQGHDNTRRKLDARILQVLAGNAPADLDRLYRDYHDTLMKLGGVMRQPLSEPDDDGEVGIQD